MAKTKSSKKTKKTSFVSIRKQAHGFEVSLDSNDWGDDSNHSFTTKEEAVDFLMNEVEKL